MLRGWPWNVGSGVHRVSGDQAGSTAIGQVGPEPVEDNGRPVASARKEQDMGEAPEPPGGSPPKPKPTDLHDGCQPANGRKIAIVAILEGPRRLVPLDGCADHRGDVLPLLLCRGGQTRDAGAHPPVRRGGVADREY